MKLVKIMLVLSAGLLVGCATERNYRGVPETTWSELSGEQKQLIVDNAYEDEIKKQSMPK
jgi:hypothetical protein